MNLKSICEDALEIVSKTAAFVKNERLNFSNLRIEEKGRHNFVTHVDKEAEKRLVSGLNALFPKAGFIAEEGTRAPGKETFNWIIDPLDGTTNYIHGAPPYSISVALAEHDTILLGIVFEIFSSEIFHAYKDAPAYLNGVVIKVSSASKLSEALIATGFPYTDFGRMEPFMRSLEYFFTNSHGVRRLGSAAADLAYVACGRYDAFYEYSLNPWDVAAGVILVQQAGGKISDFRGGQHYLLGGEIVAANAGIHAEFLEKVGEFMNK